MIEMPGGITYATINRTTLNKTNRQPSKVAVKRLPIKALIRIGTSNLITFGKFFTDFVNAWNVVFGALFIDRDPTHQAMPYENKFLSKDFLLRRNTLCKMQFKQSAHSSHTR